MSPNLRLPPGSLILVTGASGYIASHLVDQLIKRGYRVRGTVRDPSKQSWMKSRFGSDFSLVAVPDLGAPNALDEAVKGVDGIAHVAANVTFSTDAEGYIPPVVQSSINVLEAAAKEPSVKAVVHTSSQAAVLQLHPGEPYTVTRDSWNEVAVAAVKSPPENPDFSFAALVYSAAKVLAERGSWEWVEKNKPSFTFNVVVPNVNFGPIISVKDQGFRASAGLLRSIWDGSSLAATFLPPEWCTDVRDTALLHLAALTLEEVKDERIFGFAEQFDWPQVLETFKKVLPDRKFTAEFQDGPKDQGTVPNERAEELLKLLGQKGWKSLEESVRSIIPDLEEGDKVDFPKSEMDRLVESQMTGSF